MTQSLHWITLQVKGLTPTQRSRYRELEQERLWEHFVRKWGNFAVACACLISKALAGDYLTFIIGCLMATIGGAMVAGGSAFTMKEEVEIRQAAIDDVLNTTD